MFLYILIIFVLYGWIEFEILMLVSDQIGGLASFLGVFVTAIIGVSLLKSQSRQVMQGLQAGAQPHGGKIVTSLASGISLLLGALLMLLPGYFTDAVGIICFIPVSGLSWQIICCGKQNIAAMRPSFGTEPDLASHQPALVTSPNHPIPMMTNEQSEGDFMKKHSEKS